MKLAPRLTFLAMLWVFLLTACAPAAPAGPAPATDLPAVTLSEPEPTHTPAVEEPATDEPFEASATDALGNLVTLAAKPMRIVSLTLGTDEILLDLVGPERLIGVTYLASDPTTSNIAGRPELLEVPNTVEASPEQIIALEPDLVFVATFTDAAVIEQLQSAGLAVFAVGNFSTIDSMKENILLIGSLVGEPQKAEALVAQMTADLDAIADAISAAEGEPISVLYLASGGWVAGSATTVDDMIQHAGGVNAAAEAGLVDWNQVGEEAIIEMNPDVVILSPYVTDDEFRDNPVFAGVSAVQNDRVTAITDAHMSATSHYIVLGVEDIARLLYPDLMPGE